VPALEDDGRSREDDGVAALPPSAVEELARLLAQVGEGLSVRQFSVLKNELRHRQDLSTGERAVMLAALDEAWNDRASKKGGKSSDGSSRAASDPYARKAVILGPKNFCFLFDADGKPRIVRGPARVFPGPHDTFMIRGSRRRVYDAYELGEHQALYLRIISPVSRAQLLARLPAGTAVEAREHFEAGYEFLVRGLPSVFFPFIEAEVLNPLTREPHVGNDHDNVVLSAIGIDQKSGIYVRDLRTGMVKMVRGETSYLVDPRSEEHVHRNVPHDRWNLWIGHAEPHKVTTAAVTTPWALSVIIPNNEAVLVTSRHGRRVVLGPRTELLEFEEQLTPIKLSKGKSKDGHTTITTAYLRIQGGRVADNFEVESSDFVRFRVKLALAGSFEGEPERWFNVEDPVKLLADTVRARIREAARSQQATQILQDLPNLVRQALFGDKPNLVFPDNGMVLSSVDVLGVQVADNALAELFGNVQREAVSLQLQDQQARRRVESTRNRDQIDAEEHLLQRSASQRMAETSRAEAQDSHATELHKLGLAADRDDLKQARKHKARAGRRRLRPRQPGRPLRLRRRAPRPDRRGRGQSRRARQPGHPGPQPRHGRDRPADRRRLRQRRRRPPAGDPARARRSPPRRLRLRGHEGRRHQHEPRRPARRQEPRRALRSAAPRLAARAQRGQPARARHTARHTTRAQQQEVTRLPALPGRGYPAAEGSPRGRAVIHLA
jgi:major vault protein